MFFMPFHCAEIFTVAANLKMLQHNLSELGAQAQLCVEGVNNICSSQFGILELWEIWIMNSRLSDFSSTHHGTHGIKSCLLYSLNDTSKKWCHWNSEQLESWTVCQQGLAYRLSSPPQWSLGHKHTVRSHSGPGSGSHLDRSVWSSPTQRNLHNTHSCHRRSNLYQDSSWDKSSRCSPHQRNPYDKHIVRLHSDHGPGSH